MPPSGHPDFWDTPAPGSATGNPTEVHQGIFGQYALASRPDPRGTMSVEQIGHEMLTHAFRQASLKHHPDHGGDPENMRRVYVVRNIFLHAIHNT